jgi:hypothetical protein
VEREERKGSGRTSGARLEVGHAGLGGALLECELCATPLKPGKQCVQGGTKPSENRRLVWHHAGL